MGCSNLWFHLFMPPYNRIVIRIRCDAKISDKITSLGLKFGCEPNEETVHLIQLMKNLNLNLHGFSFHVGSPCEEFEAYARGIAMCKQLITVSKAIGFDKVQLIDIGGGFPDEDETDTDKVYRTYFLSSSFHQNVRLKHLMWNYYLYRYKKR